MARARFEITESAGSYDRTDGTHLGAGVPGGAGGGMRAFSPSSTSMQLALEELDVVMRETDKAVLFETRDREQSGAAIHKSYVMK